MRTFVVSLTSMQQKNLQQENMGLEYREKKAITTEGERPERQQLLLVEQAVPRLVLPLIVLCSRQVFRCASPPSLRQCLRLLGFNMFKNPNQTQMAANKQKTNRKSILLSL